MVQSIDYVVSRRLPWPPIIKITEFVARLDFALICVLIFICVWKGEGEGDGEGESPCDIHERRRGEDALHKR